MPRSRLTTAGIRRALTRALPAEIAEVLVPCLQWRIGKRSVSAVLPNQVWEDLFHTWARDVCQRVAEEAGLELRIRSSSDETEQAENRQATLAGFLQDPGNQFALTACRSVIDAPGVEHNPLYLYGPAGCGKSHLLRAVGGELSELLGEDLVVALSARDWVAHQAQELAERGSSELRDRLAGAALITFDDLDDLAGRALAQEQLFHLINEALSAGQQLVVAGRSQPRGMAGIEDRLATRLAWGLAIALEVPLTETRAALLRQITGDLLDDHDVGDPAQLVDRLAPDMHQVVALSERILQGERMAGPAAATAFDTIVATVAKHFQLRPRDIAGKRRHRQVTTARQVALLLGRRLTDYSLEALGGMVGGRDHSTVLYSIRQAESKIADDPDFAAQVNRLTQQVLEPHT